MGAIQRARGQAGDREIARVVGDLTVQPPARTPSAPGSASILALDLGTSTGWAMCADGHIVSGTESFKPGRFEGGGMRYLRFRRWLAEVKATTEGLEAIYFEEVRRHAGVDAAHAYGGFLATLTAWCEHHKIPYQGVPVGTIKKHATGKGNATKGQMTEAMRALGHSPADDIEADALALLAWARKAPPPGLRALSSGLLTSQAISERA